jgi:hypothetical protein
MNAFRTHRLTAHYVKIYGISRDRAADLAYCGYGLRQRVLHAYHMWVLRMERQEGVSPATNPQWFRIGLEALISERC